MLKQSTSLLSEQLKVWSNSCKNCINIDSLVVIQQSNYIGREESGSLTSCLVLLVKLGDENNCLNYDC